MIESRNFIPGREAGPVSSGERIESLDTLRGVAVLGILVMNIYAFAMPFAAYVNPFQMGGEEPWNLATWVFTHVFFDQKFMSIFSMLFGAGIVLMMGRADDRGVRFTPIFFRRQFWLLVIGVLHIVLIWWGDILAYYAIVGMLVFFVRRLSAQRLMLIALLMLPVPLLVNYGMSFYVEDVRIRAAAMEERAAAGEELSEEDNALLEGWTDMRRFLAPTREDVREDVEIYLGDYADMLVHRFETNLPMLLTAVPVFVFWRVGGLMILGMALMKLGVLSGERPTNVYRRLALVGYGTGLPLAALSAWGLFANDFDPVYNLRIGSIANYIGSVLVGLAHVALIILITRSGRLATLVARFRAVGRMALTNYLMHSAVLTTLFYGYGLGLYGQVPRLAQMLFVLGMVGAQLALSPWWLAKFRFGPVEWVWRSLTYGRRQRFRAG